VAREVLQDGLALHNGELAVVMIDEHGDTAVGPQVGEPLLFLDVLHYADALEDIVGFPVGLFDLFKDDGRFVACTSPR